MVHALLILTRKYKNTGAGYEREILHSTKVWAPSVRRVRACNLVGREGHLNGKEVRAHKYSDAHTNTDKVTKNDLQWFQHAILTRPPPFFLLLSPCNRRCKQNTHTAPTRCPLTRLPPFLFHRESLANLCMNAWNGRFVLTTVQTQKLAREIWSVQKTEEIPCRRWVTNRSTQSGERHNQRLAVLSVLIRWKIFEWAPSLLHAIV